jgi:hypothetical protein
VDDDKKFFSQENAMTKVRLLSMSICLGCATFAQGAIMQTNSQYIGNATNPPSPIVTDFSNSLVLQGSSTLASSSFSPNFNPYNGSSPAVLNDGSAGSAEVSSETAVSNGTLGGSWTLTYNLNTSVNTNGYNINQITALTRWTTDYVNQAYDVYYATTTNPTLTQLGGEVDYNTADPNFEQVSLQTALTNGSGGPLLSHVTELQFTFLPSISAGSGNYPAYTEIGVFGAATQVPEPSTLVALCGLGAIGLLLVAGRRRQVWLSKSPALVLSALCVFAATNAVHGAVMESDASSTTQTNFDGNILNNDLIENGSAALSGPPTTTGSVSSYGGDVAPYNNFSNLTDGLASTKVTNNDLSHDTYFDGSDFTATTPTITYSFSNPRGMTLTSINSISGWADTPSFSNQDYKVLVSHVGTPSNFVLLTSVDYNPWDPSYDGPNSTQVTLTGSGGPLATGVAAIEFQFINNGGSGQVFREIDVVGSVTAVPEPSSVMALCGLGGIGLLLVVRHRCKASVAAA